MRHTLLTAVIFFASCALSCAASAQEILINLSKDQPALYEFLDKNFDFEIDSNAPKKTQMSIVDPNDPKKGMRYEVHLLGRAKVESKELFSVRLNLVEIGYDKAGKPAFPTESVRSIPHIESVTLSESKQGKAN